MPVKRIVYIHRLTGFNHGNITTRTVAVLSRADRVLVGYGHGSDEPRKLYESHGS